MNRVTASIPDQPEPQDAAAAPEEAAAHADQAKPDETGGATNIAGEQSWRNLLEIDTQLFKHRNIRILTPEARVLIHLMLNGSMPVTAAMQLAGVSYRGFYAVLERLKQAGLVGQVKDDDDQRVRNLRLDPSNPIPGGGL